MTAGDMLEMPPNSMPPVSEDGGYNLSPPPPAQLGRRREKKTEAKSLNYSQHFMSGQCGPECDCEEEKKVQLDEQKDKISELEDENAKLRKLLALVEERRAKQAAVTVA